MKKTYQFIRSIILLSLFIAFNTTIGTVRALTGNLSLIISGTSEPYSTESRDGSVGNERPVLIGEIVRYNLTLDVSEGTSTNLLIVDNLPSGMQYMGNPAFSYNNWTGPQPAAPTVTGGAGVGDAVTFTYATITNPDNDGDIESVTIEFDAIVSNIVANQDGVFLTNNADLFVGGSLITSSENRIVEIIEPSLTITQTINLNYEGSGLILTPPNNLADAGDEFTYRVRVTNNGNAPAYDVRLVDFIPIDYLEQFGTVITTSTVSTCCFTYNGGTGLWNFGWDQIDPGQSPTADIRVRVRNTVAPLDTWTNTADITYNSLPDNDGSLNNVPGLPGASNGLRNGGDGVGGALNHLAATATSPTITVPELVVDQQVEYPLDVPIATGFFGSTYSDSTSDPNTGHSLYVVNNVDLAIGEEFNYIVTITFPEGTTYDLTLIDLVSPNGHTGGLQNAVIDMLSAEIIYVGENLTLGSSLGTVGTTFNIEDSSPADGDGTRSQFWAGGARDVLNSPDGIYDSNDMYVIRIRARIDDEDNAGGDADDVGGIVQNRDGDRGGNRLQYQWNPSTNLTANPPVYTENSVDPVDFVEPFVDITKTTVAGADLESGDTATFDLVVSNTLNAPAYNMEVTDTLPNDGTNVYLSFAGVDAANSDCDDLTGFGVSTSGFDVIFTWDQLLVGQSCTIRFNTTITAFMAPNETYTNSVTVTSYDSLDDASQPDNRNYSGGSDTSTVSSKDTIAPTVLSHTLLANYSTGPAAFDVTFSENVRNTGNGALPDDAASPENYVIMEQGSVGGFQTTACSSIDAANDTRFPPVGVTYAPNTASVNLGGALPNGSYRLFVCGTTSIVDLSGNPLNGVADFTFDFTVNSASLSVAVEQASGQPDPTNASPINFTATFSGPINASTFDPADITLGGTAPGTLTAVITEVSPNNGTTFNIAVSGMSGSGTVTASIDAGKVQDLVENFNTASTVSDNSVLFETNALSIRSSAAHDGWVLESTETSSKGGTKNNRAATLLLGDDASDRQYRSVLSFNTGGIPDGAAITSVTLRLKQHSYTGGSNIIGNFGGIVVDVKKGSFGKATLQLADFNRKASLQVGPYFPTLSATWFGWYEIDLTPAAAFINDTGNTQVRLRFKLGDNDNRAANLLRLYSGNAGSADRPQLIIEYIAP